MKAVVITEPGGPEVLRVEAIPDATAGRGQVLVRLEAGGINYADIRVRRGQSSKVPVTGVEGAGTIVALGEDVSGAEVGDRVAWPLTFGSFAELVAVPLSSVIPLPDGISSETAAAVVAAGVTAHFLINDTFPVGEGTTVLIHAGSSGVARLAVQLAHAKGARVFTTTSSDSKAASARAAGADEVLTYHGFAQHGRDLTGGHGVDVVYDGVGASTFDESLRAVRPHGTVVLYGATSGSVPPFNPTVLGTVGSPFLTVPSFASYVTSRENLITRANELFDLIARDALDPAITGRYSFDEVADAHRRIESRNATGKLVVIPPQF